MLLRRFRPYFFERSKLDLIDNGDAVIGLAEQETKTILRQAGRERKRRRSQRSNLSFTKQPKLCSELYCVPDK